jgi:hypothetical protein
MRKLSIPVSITTQVIVVGFGMTTMMKTMALTIGVKTHESGNGRAIATNTIGTTTRESGSKMTQKVLNYRQTLGVTFSCKTEVSTTLQNIIVHSQKKTMTLTARIVQTPRVVPTFGVVNRQLATITKL